jgi:uncharacterized protein
MNAMQIIANAARRLDALFPGYFPESKHNHYRDFGWPEHLEFQQLYSTYRRNGLAKAGINKTILKTWQDMPALWESAEPAETGLESDIRQRFDDIRFWARMAEVDRRSMVGGYAGAILRFADSKRFNQPVDTVPGGLLGLVEIIPAWAGQLTVATWDTDETSPNYGKPTMFAFHEAAVGTSQRHLKTRSFDLHPDRVVIWSTDGSVHAESALEAGFNDLMTLEKVSGAGGEGFWKNAKSGLALEIDKEAKIEDMARAMGVETDGVADAMNEQVEDFNKGFDKLLMLQGMQAKTLGVTLPSPEHFFNIALQSFAASLTIPLKILVGNQTGERASTEDQREWAQTNMARRDLICRPAIREIVARMERFSILPERDWAIGWSDLTEASASEKIERADKMATINQKNGALEPVYTADEIRDVTGHAAFEENDE